MPEYFTKPLYVMVVILSWSKEEFVQDIGKGNKTASTTLKIIKI
jgi:hypothetical protein